MQRVLVAALSLALALVVLAFAGCGQAPQTNGTSGEPTGGMAPIKVGGSSTLAPAIAKMADDFMEEHKTWNKVDPALPDEAIVIFVSTGGSGFGVKGVLDGTFDIGLVARDLKEEERASVSEGVCYKVAVDALTIAVHPDNPVTQVRPNLTTDELRRIFAGEIRTWSDLDPGLPNQSIVLAVRDPGGGASQVFDECVMHGTPVSADALQLPSMGALAGKVMDNVNAIGYVSLGLVRQNPDRLAVLDVDGVSPTMENIVGGEYKIGRPLLVVTKNEPTGPMRLFLDYVLSERGQKVLEGMGFVPVVN